MRGLFESYEPPYESFSETSDRCGSSRIEQLVEEHRLATESVHHGAHSHRHPDPHSLRIALVYDLDMYEGQNRDVHPQKLGCYRQLSL